MYKEYCDLLWEEILTDMRREFVKDYKKVMDYELTKQLKEAGFPQKGGSGRWATNCTDTKCQKYIPTLSELIESCGDGFFSLSKHIGFWSARTKQDCRGLPWAAWEKTPEEAVAGLYLKLQEDKN